MTTCSFCGHPSPDTSRSCVACGNVFAPAPRAEPPPDTSTGEAAPPRDETGEAVGPSEVRPRQTGQAVALALASAAAALAAAITVWLDATHALDVLRDPVARAALPSPPRFATRTDLASLADYALVAGALVMLGGWTQALVTTGTPQGAAARPSEAALLWGWLVPGWNLVAPAALVASLAGPTVPAVVRWWQGMFPAALAARYGELLWGFALAPDPTSTDAVYATAAVASGTRVLWTATLVLTAATVRRVSAAVTTRG